VDLNIAQHVLRIEPFAPLTAEAVEAAYSREAWARHPSLYPDGDARRAAEQWARTLAEARELLLATALSNGASTPAALAPAVPAPAIAAPAPAALAPAVAATGTAAAPERRRTGIVLAIAGGSLVLIALFGAAAFGATKLVEQLDTALPLPAGEPIADDEALPDMERFFSGETLFTFPAALEMYSDGRYDDRCPTSYEWGCWQMALFPEQACVSMQVDLGFSNDADAYEPEILRETVEAHVDANAPTIIVFGNDEYEYGWIHDVSCLDDAVA
jgi:hypothetical protein